MKKFFLLVFSITLFIIMFTSNVYAIDNHFILDDDGYHYYDFSDLTTLDSIIIQSDPGEILEYQDFVYMTWTSTILSTSNTVSDFNKLVFTWETNGSWFDLIVSFYKDDNQLKSFPTLSYENKNMILGYKGVRKLVDINNIPEDQFNTVEDLPTTIKSDNISVTSFGDVKFTVDGYNLIVTIMYYQTYRLKYIMSQETDMNIFNTIEALYLNPNGDTPQIFINHSSNHYLSDMLDGDAKAFVQHSIWDLNTNNLKVVKDYKAHAFIKQNNEGALIAYYYTDAFIMDHILNAKLTYTSRIHKVNWFGLENSYTEWQRKVFDYTSEDYLDYRDLTSNWGLWIPGWNLIASNIQTSTYYQMPRIDEVSFPNLQPEYNVTLAELNDHFRSKTPNFDNLLESGNYKIFAFALEEGKSLDFGLIGKLQTEFYYDELNSDNPDNFKIMNIVYMTDSKVYVTVGDDIDAEIILDDPILPTVPSENPFLVIWQWIQNNWLLILIVSLFILVLPVIGFILNGIGSIKKGLYSLKSSPDIYSKNRYYSRTSALPGLIVILLIAATIFLLAKGLGWL